MKSPTRRENLARKNDARTAALLWFAKTLNATEPVQVQQKNIQMKLEVT
jgi:hypothetical protein